MDDCFSHRRTFKFVACHGQVGLLDAASSAMPPTAQTAKIFAVGGRYDWCRPLGEYLSLLSKRGLHQSYLPNES